MASAPAKTNVKAVASWGLAIACIALVFGVVSFAYVVSTYKTAKEVTTTTKSIVKTSAHAISKVDELEKFVSGMVAKLKHAPPPQAPPSGPQMMQSAPLDFPPRQSVPPMHQQAPMMQQMQQQGPMMQGPMMQGPMMQAPMQQPNFGAAPSNFGWSGGRNPEEAAYDDPRSDSFYS